MPHRFAVLLAFALSVLLSGALSAADEEAPLLLAATDDAALAAAKGKPVIVRGKVTRTGKAKATGVNFLNFGSGDFTVVTYGKNLKAFPDGEPADLFQDKYIEVRGEITFYKDKPQIELASPDQISVIDQQTSDEALAKPDATAKVAPKGDAKDAKVEPEKGTKPTEVDPKKYFTD